MSIDFTVVQAVRQRFGDQKADLGGGRPMAQKSDGLSDDYAATGMGRRERHEVESVDIDLERDAAASIRIRYEFTPQLVKMGILPSASPMERRERARGFGSYCPEP